MLHNHAGARFWQGLLFATRKRLERLERRPGAASNHSLESPSVFYFAAGVMLFKNVPQKCQADALVW